MNCRANLLQIFISMLLSNKAYSVSMEMEDFVFGSCTFDDSDVLVYGISYVQCLNECRARANCLAVSMHARAGICRLSMDSLGQVDDDCWGYVFSEKDDWKQEELPECYGVTCQTAQACVVDHVTESAACSYKECPMPTDLQSQGITTIAGSRQVGSRITYICNGLGSLIGGPIVRTCSADDGQWTGTEPGCVFFSYSYA